MLTRKDILNSNEEPTDAELAELMKEVLHDVKKRYLKAKEDFDKKINEEVLKAKASYKERHS